MKAFCLIALCFLPPLTQAQPAWQWAKVANDPGESMCNSIATDAAGNAYVVGTFTGTLDFGTTTLTSTDDSDIFFAKYDPSGNLLWAKHEGGPGGDQGFGIAVDAQGYIYVAGTFYQSIAFDTFSFTSNGLADLCLSKYDNNGNLIWAKAWGSIYEDLGSKIVVDHSDNIILTGYFASDGASPPSHGSIAFDTVTLTSKGGADVFILKLDNGGNTIWAKDAGGVFGDYSMAVTGDHDDNIYISGEFTDPWIQFDTIRLYTKAHGNDMFIAKYDSMGNAIWSRGAGGDFDTDGAGIATDTNENVYVTGSNFAGSFIKFDNNITIANDRSFIVKYDVSGSLIWARPTATNSLDVTQGIVADDTGFLYTTGFFYDQAHFGTDTLSAAGSSDIFLCKYDNGGNIIWAKQAGGSSGDAGYCLILDNQVNILTAGYTGSHPAGFDAIQVSATLSTDPFIAKLSNPLSVQQLKPASGNVGIYPNPVDDILYITSGDDAFDLVQLTDLTGRVLLSHAQLAKNVTISLKNIPAGLYYLRLSGNAGCVTKKIIIEH